MKHFIIEQSSADITSYSDLSLTVRRSDDAPISVVSWMPSALAISDIGLWYDGSTFFKTACFCFRG